MGKNVLQLKQLERYGEDGLKYLKESQLLDKYILKMQLGGDGSAVTVRSRLNNFGY
ncbi:MAG TPA: hypothetical protein VHK86_05595 [Nitrososphaera sp.]|jgi:hypothetical protein|nr:hypothetical protein [Nitrososphaera sp.]